MWPTIKLFIVMCPISQFLRGKLIAKLNGTNIDTTHYQYSALAGN